MKYLLTLLLLFSTHSFSEESLNRYTIDSNGNECDNPEFAVDKKSTHPPSDLLEWGIRGVTMGHSSPLQITWDMDDLSDDYEIFLYVGETGYNMRQETAININSSDLFPTYEEIEGEWVSFDNIKILTLNL